MISTKFDATKLHYEAGIVRPFLSHRVAADIDGIEIVYDGYRSFIPATVWDAAMYSFTNGWTLNNEQLMKLIFRKEFVNELIKQNQYVNFIEL